MFLYSPQLSSSSLVDPPSSIREVRLGRRILAAACSVGLLSSIATGAWGGSLWSQTYGGPATFEQPWELHQLPDRTILIGGVTDSYGTESGDAWWIRIAEDGSVLDERVFGNALPGGVSGIAFDEDGGMAVVGAHTLDILFDRDAWIHHVDAAGNIDWAWSFDFDPGMHAFYAVEATSDGGYIATGSSAIDTGIPIWAWVVKFDSDGNVSWQNRYHGGTAEHANFVIETMDGGYAIAGWTTSSGAGSTDAWLLKISSLGEIEWQKTYGGFGPEEATGLIQTADGGYALSAFTDTYPESGHGAWVLRLDEGGEVLWNAVMGDEWADFRDIVQTGDGNLVATGRISGPATNDLWVVKFRDTDGAVMWQRTYEGTEGDWGSRTIELAGGDLLIGGVWAWGFPDEDIWLQRTDSFGLIPSCSLIHDSAVVTSSPNVTTRPANTSISAPTPVRVAINFEADVSTLSVNEKCRALTNVEETDEVSSLVDRISVTPNPVDASTTIEFRLEETAHIRLDLHDAGGRRVETLADDIFPAGEHQVIWKRTQEAPLAAGVYFLTLSHAGGATTERAILIR